MQTDNRKTRRAPWVWRIIRARPRLFVSFMVSIAATVALAVLTDWRPVMRDLVGWDIGVGLSVILAFEMMARADVHQIRRRAAAQDEGAIVILILTVAAALASILAIVGLLGTSAAGAAPRRSVELILATITIVLSWLSSIRCSHCTTRTSSTTRAASAGWRSRAVWKSRTTGTLSTSPWSSA